MGVGDKFVAILVAGIHEILQPIPVDPVGAQSDAIDFVGTFDACGFVRFYCLPMLPPEHTDPPSFVYFRFFS
jgi:hypothetical protein